MKKAKDTHDKAAFHRWNTRAAEKRLANKIQSCFPPHSGFYTLPLDFHHFKLTPELLYWHWRNAFIEPLRARIANTTPPLPLRYIYTLDWNAPCAPAYYLLTNAPENAVRAVFANFWIHGDALHMEQLQGVGAQHIAHTMTVQVHGIEGARGKMYISSRMPKP